MTTLIVNIKYLMLVVFIIISLWVVPLIKACRALVYSLMMSFTLQKRNSLFPVHQQGQPQCLLCKVELMIDLEFQQCNK